MFSIWRLIASSLFGISILDSDDAPEAGMVKLKKAKLAAVAIEYQRRAVLWFRGECRYIPARLDATQKLRGPSGGKRHIEAVQWLL